MIIIEINSEFPANNYIIIGLLLGQFRCWYSFTMADRIHHLIRIAILARIKGLIQIKVPARIAVVNQEYSDQELAILKFKS